MPTQAKKDGNKRYRARILAGLECDMGTPEHTRAVEYCNKQRKYAADSARRAYHEDDALREQKRRVCRERYYYDDPDRFVTAIRRLFR